MRKYFLELFAIGLVDSEGRINTEHMTSDALMTAMKTMEELTQMKMDRLVLETTMEMILCIGREDYFDGSFRKCRSQAS